MLSKAGLGLAGFLAHVDGGTQAHDARGARLWGILDGADIVTDLPGSMTGRPWTHYHPGYSSMS
jgi:hypothetical protein